MPPTAKTKASEELAARYDELGLDLEIDRLDRTVEANEMKIHQLTQRARTFLAAHNYREFHDVLDAARKLQSQNSDLLRTIDRAEEELSSASR